MSKLLIPLVLSVFAANAGASLLVSKAFHQFPVTAPGSTSSISIYVDNESDVNQPIKIDSKNLSDSVAILDNCGAELDPGQRCLINLEWSPSKRSYLGSGFTIQGQDRTHYIHLKGATKSDGRIVVERPHVNFGKVPVGTAGVSAVYLRNPGFLDTTWEIPDLPSNVILSGTCLDVIPGGGSCNLIFNWVPVDEEDNLNQEVTLKSATNDVTISLKGFTIQQNIDFEI